MILWWLLLIGIWSEITQICATRSVFSFNILISLSTWMTNNESKFSQILYFLGHKWEYWSDKPKVSSAFKAWFNMLHNSNVTTVCCPQFESIPLLRFIETLYTGSWVNSNKWIWTACLHHRRLKVQDQSEMFLKTLYIEPKVPANSFYFH